MAVERNFRLDVEYDGEPFHGWQRQKDRRSVQGEIEAALAQMIGGPVTLIGSGRTDAGVHALGQVAGFRSTTRLGADVLQRGLNSLLPAGIVVRACREVDPAFHARYDVRAKTYRYRILNRRVPAAIGRQYAWHIRRPLDVAAMRSALTAVIGTHDFKSFEAAGSPRTHTVRRILRAEVTIEPEAIRAVELTGDGFLRGMVRNIVGTLVEVGLGKRSPDQMAAVLAARDRRRAGATAPAHGLFLMAVDYFEPDEEL